MQVIQSIQNRIYEIRGEQVMLDFDLAVLYEVETRVFNQAVKRNINSFPEEFMFRLSAKEWQDIVLQHNIVPVQQKGTQKSPSSQIVMMGELPKNRTGKYLPYAFTEHGVTMLASVLKSPVARKMNIAIVKAFIAMRKTIIQYNGVIKVIEELKDRVSGHDAQLNQIYDALENMLDKKMEEENKHNDWNNRERIGFKKK